MRARILTFTAFAVATAIIAVACGAPEGDEGPEGSPGPQGTAGPAGPGALWRDANGDVQRIITTPMGTYWFDANGIGWRWFDLSYGTLVPEAQSYYFASSDCSGPAYFGLYEALARVAYSFPDGSLRAIPDSPTISSNFVVGSVLDPPSPCNTVSGGTLPRAIHSSDLTIVAATTPTPLAVPLHIEFVP